MIENSAESPLISANQQPGFSGQSDDKKTFSANKDNFIQILILNCRFSRRMMRIAG